MDIKIPVFVKAKTASKLMVAMAELQDELGANLGWSDIQFAQGEWYAWARVSPRIVTGGAE